MKTFSDLNLNPELLKIFTEKFHFTHPKPIQEQIIPIFHNSFPLIFQAETGSGKTLAYILPILSHYFNIKSDFPLLSTPRVLFIAPTRVLARQIFEILTDFNLPVASFIGGESQSNLQFFTVATPGKALFESENFKNLDFLVLDEADRLIQMEDCQKFIRGVRGVKTVMSSATTEGLKQLGNVVKCEIDQNQFLKPQTLQIGYSIVPVSRKYSFLAEKLREFSTGKIVIFTLTCAESRFLWQFLQKKFPEVQIYNLNGKQHSQVQIKNLQKFTNSNQFSILITTDISARGLDVENVNFVVQFDCPQRLETLVHRAGRAGRNEQAGKCLILIDNNESDIVEMLKNRGIFAQKEVEIESIEQNFCEQKKIQFYKKELKRQKKQKEIEEGKGGVSMKVIDDQIKQLEVKIGELEALEAIFNEKKRAIFDLESSQFLRQMAMEDRGFFDLAQEAFISFVRAYQEYEMKYIFDFAKLDLGQLAMSMGLLKLPSMKELKSRYVYFLGETVDLNELKYVDQKKEKERIERQVQAQQEKLEKMQGENNEEEIVKKVEKEAKKEVKKGKVEPVQKIGKVFNNQKFSSEYELLQKFKKGLITEQELEDML